ncbi:hypothetical protein BN3658_01289 [Coriobacteriaceae bacterium CHKCI002]|nr:hypothetical protein BN3658_01289 [Coriobacteriaceae bacterium CHKCI002]
MPVSALAAPYSTASATSGSDRSSAHVRCSAAANVMIEASATSCDEPLGTRRVRLNRAAMTTLDTAIASTGPAQAGTLTAAADPKPAAAPASNGKQPGGTGTATAGPKQHAIIHAV